MVAGNHSPGIARLGTSGQMTEHNHENRQRLNPKLQLEVDALSGWWTKRAAEISAADAVREPLYHYTGMSGMLGIIATEHMWFTSIFHLNDPSELGYGLGIALDLLKEEADRGTPSVEAFCKWMSHVLVKAGGEIFGFFVASFSRKDNDLGQWRAYADNGRGVAVGLAPSLFEVVPDESSLKVTEKTIVARVIYDPKRHEQNLREAIGCAIEGIARGEQSATSEAEREEFGKAMAIELAVPIFTYSITCKHPAYEQEQETRLLLVNDLHRLGPFIETRTRGSALVPYIQSPLPVRKPGALTKIMIGPAADELADDAIRAFFRRQGLPLDILDKSDIPYAAR